MSGSTVRSLEHCTLRWPLSVPVTNCEWIIMLILLVFKHLVHIYCFLYIYIYIYIYIYNKIYQLHLLTVRKIWSFVFCDFVFSVYYSLESLFNGLLNTHYLVLFMLWSIMYWQVLFCDQPQRPIFTNLTRCVLRILIIFKLYCKMTFLMFVSICYYLK